MNKSQTFTLKRDAEKWAFTIESQAEHIAAGGFAPLPKGTRLADLIDKYVGTMPSGGRTKTATLNMLRAKLGQTPMSSFNAVTLREFIDVRIKEGAGGVTVAADLSFLSAVLKWARHARHLDVDDRLALDARAGLKHRNLNTRGLERNREPTDDELARLYAHWATKKLRLPMTTICRFALATSMRQDELCRLQIEDIDREAKTVVIRDRKDPKRKAGNDQVVPLLPDAWAIAEPLIEGREVGRLFAGAQAPSVSAAFTRACTALGIKDLHFHDLRHRAAADFFRAGLTIPTVAVLTGHKTWAMLRRYTDIKAADVHAAFAAASRTPDPAKA